MFKAVMENIDVLRDSISTISELIDETQIRISPAGIRMTAADRAVVVLVDFFLSKNAFTSYEADSDHNIGVNMQNFLQILRRSAPCDRMTMELDGGKMKITFKNESTRHFVLPLIDISRDEAPPLDKLEFSAHMKANMEVIGSGIEDAEIVADSIIFTVRKDMLTMKSESDTSMSQLELPSGTESLKIIDIGEPVRSRYSLDYLKKIVKARKLSNEALMAMANDYPMKIEFEVPDKARLSFVLAPRIE